MIINNLPEPILITKFDELERFADILAAEPIIAVDTESNSLYAYQEQVCLIQFSTKNKDYLVDPLVLGDLSSLAPIFANPNVEKVFHAAEYDLICLERDFGFSFANIFDTMVAARILGWQKVGLASILKLHYGVNVNKRHQRANWGRRPLPDQLLTYAQLDTHYLISLRNKLFYELEESGRLPLALEDFERACEVVSPDETPKDELCWRVKGAHDLNPKLTAVLQELCLYRDAMAQKLDRPLFKVIRDETLLELAQNMPEDKKGLWDIKGMTRGQIRRHGEGLLAAIDRGLEADPLRLPRKTRPDNGYICRNDALRLWRKKRARAIGVESDVVLPRDLLDQIAREDPATMSGLSSIMDAVPYRLNHFGEEILQVLREQRELL